MLGAQKYQKVARFFRATAETTPQDRARAVTRVCKMADKTKQTAAGIFASGSVAIHAGQFEGPFRALRADPRGILRHDSRREFLGLGQVEFARHPQDRSRSAGRKRQREGGRLAQAARTSSRAATPRSSSLPPSSISSVSSSTISRARRCCDKRSCLTGRMGKKLFGDNITHLGRRLSSAANRPAIRWRRRSATESAARRSRRAEESGLFARDREENEGQAHRPRLFAAQRIWRSADESGFRGRR